MIWLQSRFGNKSSCLCSGTVSMNSTMNRNQLFTQLLNTDYLVDFYRVNGSGQLIKLKIRTGKNPDASSTILLKHAAVPGPEPDGSFTGDFEIILGSNKEMNGKDFHMTTVVRNILGTNPGSLSISLTGGISRLTRKLEANAPENGESITYSVSIRFFR